MANDVRQNSGTDKSTRIDRIGLVGCGAIGQAVITGLLSNGDWNRTNLNVLVSQRSQTRSDFLAEQFPNSVIVQSDAQSIVDQCQWVFLAVLPRQARTLLESLVFLPDHRLVSFVAGLSMSELKMLASPAGKVFRMIPLPPVEFGMGPLPVFPASAELEQLFTGCGQMIPLQDEDHFTILSAASGMMSTHHAIVAKVVQWMASKNMDAETATRYATHMFHGLAKLETRTPANEFASLPRDSITKGGLNEQVLNELENLDWFAAIQDRLERIYNRLNSPTK